LFSTDLAVAVEGAEVVQDTLVLTVSAPGEAASWRQTAVRSQVSGQVRAVRVPRTGRGKGAVLIEIDPTEYRLALEEAQARLRQAEGRTGRSRWAMTASTTRACARSATRPRVRAAVWTRRAWRWTVRRSTWLRTRVVAPFAGRIANLKVVPGQHVNVGDELLTVQAMDPIKVEAKVLEGEIGYLRRRTHGTRHVRGVPGRGIRGPHRVDQPRGGPADAHARVSIAVRNPNGRMLPGMLRARIAVRASASRTGSWCRRGRARAGPPHMLFVFEGEGDTGRAKWRYVNTGPHERHARGDRRGGPEDGDGRAGRDRAGGRPLHAVHDIPVRLVDNAAKAEGARPR
jgi:membrane fusion protein, multidrug efflux system